MPNFQLQHQEDFILQLEIYPTVGDFSCSGHKKHLFRAAEQAAAFLP